MKKGSLVSIFGLLAFLSTSIPVYAGGKEVVMPVFPDEVGPLPNPPFNKAQAQKESEEACLLRYGKSLEIDKMGREINEIAEKLDRKKFPKGVVKEKYIPAVAKQDDGSIKQISTRDNFLARMKIEKAVGAKLFTTSTYNEETRKVIKTHQFERPLTSQENSKAMDAIRQSGNAFFQPLEETIQKNLVSQLLGEFITLPAVTAEDVQHLQQAAVQTPIRAPLPAFKAAEAKTSIGLYKAVMGTYPDLSKVYGLSDKKRAEIKRQWDQNPDLPLVYTTSAEDVAFATRLSQITGRKFRIMNDPENEYSIRGREFDREGKPTGIITTSTYHFGEGDDQVRKHAFILSNSGGHAHGVHEIPVGKDFKNSFGLIHPIGNVCVRSADGVLRGGAFNSIVWGAESSFRDGGNADRRHNYIGSRLAEDL